MRRTIITISFLIGTATGFAQEIGSQAQNRLQNYLELIVERNENADVEQLLNDIQYLREHPIAVNQATASEWAAFFFLSPIQIKNILAYRDEFGPILSVYELAAVEGINPDLAEFLGQFLVFEDQAVSGRKLYWNHELLLRAIRLKEQQAGYKTGKFAGSPEKLYARYRLESDKLQLGATGEKDQGEPFINTPNNAGFDFYSAFVRYQLGNNQSSVVVGDYVVQWGQGLSLWQGFSTGKSTNVDKIARFNSAIKPYSSTDENNFMRGVGINLQLKKFNFQTFVSRKRMDANMDSLNGEVIFTSIQTSGLHRTVGEIADKNSVLVFNAGGRVSFRNKMFSLGIAGIHTAYEYPLVRKEQLYNHYLFAGERNSNLSVDYKLTVNRLFVFGEFANSFKGGRAMMQGAIFQPVGQLSVSALYRRINKKYQAPYGSTFTETSQVNDENGLYLGVKLSPWAKMRVYGYADFFASEWIKYTTAGPSKGREYMINLEYDLNENWQVYSRYFTERKPVKISDAVMRFNQDQRRQSCRIQLGGKLNELVSVRSRYEHVFYKHDHWADGFLVYQDVKLQDRQARHNLWLRVAYFSTVDYDSRVYMYENDLLYQFAVPAYYGEGMRTYLTGKVKICEKISCWLKCGRTWYFGVESIGSGDTAIEGNKRTDFKFQLRFKI